MQNAVGIHIKGKGHRTPGAVWPWHGISDHRLSSSVALRSLVPCAVNTQRVPHAVNEPGKPGSTPPNWRGNCRAQHLVQHPRGEGQNAFGYHAPPALQRGHAVQRHEHAADLPQAAFTAKLPLVAAPATVRLLLPCLHHQPGSVAGGRPIVVDGKLMVRDAMPWALKGPTIIPQGFES